jgi:hypothetical protein
MLPKVLSKSAKQVMALIPRRFTNYVQTIRSRNHQVRYLERNGVLKLNQRYVEAFGLGVLSGPFQGMRYPLVATRRRHVAPRLLGSYESGLHGAIGEVRQKQYERIIDIGCAEGYYAVGLALACPKTQVFAFDAEPRERNLCQNMKELNSATNLNLGSFCTPEDLVKIAAPYRSMVLSDCEGYEARLFTAETIAALPTTDFLIELHESESAGITQRLKRLLEQTHEVKLIDHLAPTLSDYPNLKNLGAEAELCLCEYRDPSQQWLYAVRREPRR